MGIAMSAGCGDMQEPSETGEIRQSALSASDLELARHWAPIHFQDVNKSGSTGMQGRADYITRVDFDGNFNGKDNWDNLGDFPLKAYLYTGVSETTSHWFIYYTMFHPRSWADSNFDTEHENDSEGIVVMVRRNGTTFGALEGVAAVFHGGWNLYRNSPNMTGGFVLSVDANGRPRMYQQPRGHGIQGCGSDADCGLASNDSIKYSLQPTGFPAAEPPTTIPDGQMAFVGYELLDMNELYKRRFDRPTYKTDRGMAGDGSGDCGAGGFSCDNENNSAVRPIWAHDSGNSADDNNGMGEDPATFFAAVFGFTNGLTPPTNDYTRNPFLHQKCDEGRRMMGSEDPCVQAIMATDFFCRDTRWDSLCVAQVGTICGKTCGTIDTTTRKSVTCNADICTAMPGPMGTGCEGNCAARVCAADPFCCNTRWDAICASRVETVCSLSCTLMQKSFHSATWPGGSSCNGDHGVKGFGCQLSFCGQPSLYCQPLPDGTFLGTKSFQSTTFSDENPSGQTCPAGMLMTGMRCTGSNCDNMSIECAPYSGQLTSCAWETNPNGTVKVWSEEQSGAGLDQFNGGDFEEAPGVPSSGTPGFAAAPDKMWHFPGGRFATGAKCTGSFCDNMGFFTCLATP
jgi:hypothetical protein